MLPAPSRYRKRKAKSSQVKSSNVSGARRPRRVRSTNQIGVRNSCRARDFGVIALEAAIVMRHCFSQRYHIVRRIENQLNSRRIDGKLRQLSRQDPEAVIDFSSNDYISLASNFRLGNAIKRAFESFVDDQIKSSPRPLMGSGSTGSRLLTGNNALYETTESFIATFHGQSFCLLCNSGWDLNFGLMSSIPSSNTQVIYDELSHNSIIIGIRNGRQRCSIPLKHNNLQHLEQILKDQAAIVSIARKQESAGTETLIVVESVYSMDGNVCPLQDLLDLAQRYGAMVIVDEAHSVGVFGERGEGLVCHLSLERHPALLGVVYTFGKALGAHGAAFVTQHSSIITHLLNYSKPLIYSTSLPPHSLITIQEAYKAMALATSERCHLADLVELFRSECGTRGVRCIDSRSPIQGVIVPGNDAVLSAARDLQAAGFVCLPIRAPTVAAGSERLRIVLHAHNTRQQVTELCAQLQQIPMAVGMAVGMAGLAQIGPGGISAADSTRTTSPPPGASTATDSTRTTSPPPGASTASNIGGSLR